jgi:hypothetical protein
MKYASGEYDWEWRTSNLRSASPADAQPEKCAQYSGREALLNPR